MNPAVTLRTRILAAFLLAVSLILAGGAVGAFGLLQALDRYRDEVSQLRRAQADVLRLQSQFKVQVQEWKNVLLRGKDAERLDRHWKGFEKAEAEVTRLNDTLKRDLPPGKAQALISEFSTAHHTLGEGYRKGLAAFRDAGGDAAAGDKAVSGIDRVPTQRLDEVVATIGALADETAAEADAQSRRSLTLAIAIMAAAVLGSLAMFAWLIQRQIATPTLTLVRELQTLTRGELNGVIHVQAIGELGQLAHGIEALRQQLVTLIGDAKQSSGAVYAGTRDLHGAAGMIKASADRASETAATLASAMEEMLGSIEQVAEDAGSVAQQAHQAEQNVLFSRDVVHRLLDDVRGIENDLNATSSAVAEFVQNARNISGLTQQVKEIADQTNLLALNAAIEAARAGEQGRGFAVVADEVRKLAEKSAHSANEIDAVTQLLEAGTQVVERTIAEGNQRLSASAAKSSEVSSALDQAIAGVQSATQSVTHIAGAIQEQRTTIQEVAHQSEGLARLAEENSAAVDRIRTNGEQMNRHAGQLNGSLERFRV